MAKIWMVTYHHETKFYKSESTFLDAISGVRKGSVTSVKIFEEVESHDSAYEYKKSLITQRERDDQLNMILNDDKELQILYQIKKIIQDHSNIESQRTIVKPPANRRNVGNEILERFDSRGMNIKNFKGMFSNITLKNYIIYTGPSTKEWYKLILQIQKFKMDITKFNNSVLEVEKERIENYNLAKKEIEEGI
jgi:hypothetical protein